MNRPLSFLDLLETWIWQNNVVNLKRSPQPPRDGLEKVSKSKKKKKDLL